MAQNLADQYGSVYEYDEKDRAYVFVGKLNGRTLGQFLDDNSQEME